MSEMSHQCDTGEQQDIFQPGQQPVGQQETHHTLQIILIKLFCGFSVFPDVS